MLQAGSSCRMPEVNVGESEYGSGQVECGCAVGSKTRGAGWSVGAGVSGWSGGKWVELAARGRGRGLGCGGRIAKRCAGMGCGWGGRSATTATRLTGTGAARCAWWRRDGRARFRHAVCCGPVQHCDRCAEMGCVLRGAVGEEGKGIGLGWGAGGGGASDRNLIGC